MDIKTVSLRSYPLVRMEKCWPALESTREIPYVLSPSASDEIIDDVEIQTSHYRPELSRQTSYSVGKDRCAISKGTLIDIWI
jgi:hypothetical protein